MIVLLDNVLHSYEDPVLLFCHYAMYISHHIKSFRLLSVEAQTIQQYLTSFGSSGNYLAGKIGPKNLRLMIWEDKRYGPAFRANNEKVMSVKLFGEINEMFVKQNLAKPINNSKMNAIPILNNEVDRIRVLKIWEVLLEAKRHFKLPHEITVDPIKRLSRVLRSAIKYSEKTDNLQHVKTAWIFDYFIMSETQQVDIQKLLNTLEEESIYIPIVSIITVISEFHQSLLKLKSSRFLKESVPTSDFARYCILVRHSIFTNYNGARKDLVLFWNEVWNEWLNSTEEERSKKMIGSSGVYRGWADHDELKQFVPTSEESESDIDWFANDSFASMYASHQQDSGLELIQECEGENIATAENKCSHAADSMVTSAEFNIMQNDIIRSEMISSTGSVLDDVFSKADNDSIHGFDVGIGEFDEITERIFKEDSNLYREQIPKMKLGESGNNEGEEVYEEKSNDDQIISSNINTHKVQPLGDPIQLKSKTLDGSNENTTDLIPRFEENNGAIVVDQNGNSICELNKSMNGLLSHNKDNDTLVEILDIGTDDLHDIFNNNEILNPNETTGFGESSMTPEDDQSFSPDYLPTNTDGFIVENISNANIFLNKKDDILSEKFDLNALKQPGVLTTILDEPSSIGSSAFNSDVEDMIPLRTVETKDDSIPERIEMFEKLSGNQLKHRNFSHGITLERGDSEEKVTSTLKKALKPVVKRPANSKVTELKEFIEAKPELSVLRSIKDFDTEIKKPKTTGSVKKGRSISEIFSALLDDNMRDLSLSAEYRNKIVRPQDLYNRIKIDTDKPWEQLSMKTKLKYYGAFLRKYDNVLNTPESVSIDIVDLLEIVKVCVAFNDVKHKIVQVAIDLVENNEKDNNADDDYNNDNNDENGYGDGDVSSASIRSFHKGSFASLQNLRKSPFNQSMSRTSSINSINSVRSWSPR